MNRKAYRKAVAAKMTEDLDRTERAIAQMLEYVKTEREKIATDPTINWSHQGSTAHFLHEARVLAANMSGDYDLGDAIYLGKVCQVCREPASDSDCGMTEDGFHVYS